MPGQLAEIISASGVGAPGSDCPGAHVSSFSLGCFLDGFYRGADDLELSCPPLACRGDRSGWFGIYLIICRDGGRSRRPLRNFNLFVIRT